MTREYHRKLLTKQEIIIKSLTINSCSIVTALNISGFSSEAGMIDARADIASKEPLKFNIDILINHSSRTNIYARLKNYQNVSISQTRPQHDNPGLSWMVTSKRQPINRRQRSLKVIDKSFPRERPENSHNGRLPWLNECNSARSGSIQRSGIWRHTSNRLHVFQRGIKTIRRSVFKVRERRSKQIQILYKHSKFKVFRSRAEQPNPWVTNLTPS